MKPYYAIRLFHISDAGKNKGNLNLIYARNISWIDLIEYPKEV